MNTVNAVVSVPDTSLYRPVEELDAQHRIEQLEARRWEELKQQEIQKQEEQRAMIPSYMGKTVDLLV